MPVKFKESQTIRAKGSNKKTVQHFYMKSTPTEELQKALEGAHTTPKKKQKIRNELVSRNINIPKGE